MGVGGEPLRNPAVTEAAWGYGMEGVQRGGRPVTPRLPGPRRALGPPRAPCSLTRPRSRGGTGGRGGARTPAAASLGRSGVVRWLGRPGAARMHSPSRAHHLDPRGETDHAGCPPSSGSAEVPLYLASANKKHLFMP